MNIDRAKAVGAKLCMDSRSIASLESGEAQCHWKANKTWCICVLYAQVLPLSLSIQPI